MQVSVERIDDLNRKLTVQVPEDTIRQQVENRLKSLAREAKFDGFRPGKVPSAVIRKRFGKKVREEVLSDLIESTFTRALQDEKLRPAGLPQITAKGGVEGEGFVYEAAFEVFPEFVPMPVETLEIRRYTSRVTEQDVDDMVQRLREQRRTWREVERGAAMNDRLIISVEGAIDGERLGDGKIENFPFIMGGRQLFEGFGDKLMGALAGTHHGFDLDFPKDYQNPQWAGKTGHFEVDVTKVEEPAVPELDAEFVKSFGIEDGDLEALRQDVKQNMEREMNRALKARTKSG
jgi:trigger factor